MGSLPGLVLVFLPINYLMSLFGSLMEMCHITDLVRWLFSFSKCHWLVQRGGRAVCETKDICSIRLGGDFPLF